MANRYTATLPTGKSVVLQELDTETQMLALAAANENLTPQQGSFASTLESIRLMVKEADGKPVTYTDLEGRKINEVFTPKEINGLLILYGEIMGAGEAEKKALLATLKISSTPSG
jgi:hypothetical protein